RRRGRMRSLRGHASPPRQHRRARRQGPGPIEPGADRQELSAPSRNTCRLLARDHAAPEPTLALAEAASLGCERVRPLAWCSRPRSSAALPEGALMAIVVDKDTRLAVQGLTGSEGRFHGLRNRNYGTNVVAGVTPGKGGQDVEGIPVFDIVVEAVEHANANTTLIFVPARFAADAIYEAVDAGIGTVICITEHIPAH